MNFALFALFALQSFLLKVYSQCIPHIVLFICIIFLLFFCLVFVHITELGEDLALFSGDHEEQDACNEGGC